MDVQLGLKRALAIVAAVVTLGVWKRGYRKGADAG